MAQPQTSIPNPSTDWANLDWGTINKNIWDIQCEIFALSKEGRHADMHEKQKQLLSSSDAKLYAVRRVTQDNKGKKTAGIDGVKSLNGNTRFKYAHELALDGKADPVRRHYIPKPGTPKGRPLGIPTMRDRIKQELVLLTLEPQWEAIFEPNSYGFRPGRRAQDAMTLLRVSLKNHPKYVYDADIEGCFDNILHQALLNKLNTFPEIYEQIRAWLKAGVVEPEGHLIASDLGTPQGGIISPLLANIALHGLEFELLSHYKERLKAPGTSWLYNAGKATFVRYADDFVIAHSNLSFLEECIQITEKFLREVGLRISDKKTQIRVTNKSHLCPDSSYTEGFDFLGYHFRLYNTKYRGTTSNKGKKKEFIFLVKPSKKSVDEHFSDLKSFVWSHKAIKQVDLIKALNPKIQGWAWYYRYANSSETFSKLDHKLWRLLFTWAKKRHANKPASWVVSQYFHQYRNVKHRFLCRWQGVPCRVLNHYSDYSILPYRKCVADYSPYQNKGLGKNSFLPSSIHDRLYRRQGGVCKVCNGFIRHHESLEIHHLLPPGVKERNNMRFMWLIHVSCHDQLHSEGDLSIDEPKE
jgi:RNA-directed DNA polymerase